VNRMETVVFVAAPVAFALFWLALGVFLGVRLGERRLMNRIRNAPPSTPISAYMGNTVARSARQPSE
jgi:hypothetical protein